MHFESFANLPSSRWSPYPYLQDLLSCYRLPTSLSLDFSFERTVGTDPPRYWFKSSKINCRVGLSSPRREPRSINVEKVDRHLLLDLRLEFAVGVRSLRYVHCHVKIEGDEPAQQNRCH